MKKKKWFVKILKMIGICTASVLGFVGLSIGVFALFGGFNEKVVSLTGMSFEQTAYVLDGNKLVTDPNDLSKNSTYDTSIKLIPQNEDATKLDVTLTGGNNVVTLPTGNDSRVGKNLNIKLETLTYGSGENLFTYNKGGEFTLTATQEEDLLTTKTKVFVESRINSYELSANVDLNAIYPGTKFTVSRTNILPANALDKPNGAEFITRFGQNYFKKQTLFFSSNESIASVDIYTGEVEVLAEGSFYIYAYVPTTYKNNSLIPNRSDFNTDAEYFAVLEDVAADGQAFTIKKETVSFVSKPINVSGIIASSNVFNFQVNQARKYSFNNQYNFNDNKLELNISLKAPENSTYTNDQLNYKLQDIQIFEGYKNPNGNYFLSANQIYDNGVLRSNYFDIEQNINPLYYTITAVDHTSTKDLYLIARISNKKLEVIGESDILCTDQTIDANGDYVYYAFIKVNTNIIENESINLTTNKVLGSFTQLANENYLLNGSELLNLEDLITSILPENSTYNLQKDENGAFKYIKFYVDNNEDGVIGTIQATEGAKHEIPFVTLEGAENETPKKGYFVRALKEGIVKIYVAVGKKGRTDTNFEELFASNYITLVVTQTITFSEFVVDATPDEETGVYKLIKGNDLIITFKTDNIEGFIDAYQEGFFSVSASAAEKIIVNANMPGDDGLIKLTVTGVNKGNITLRVLFNGLNLIYINEDSHFEEFEGININVIDNALTAIAFNTTEINQNNEINFTVRPVSTESSEIEFITDRNTIVYESKPLEIEVEITGGNDATTLNINYSSQALEMNISKEGDSVNKFKLTIIPKMLCENVQFYIGSNTSSVTSQTIIINIKADYNIIANYKNSIVMNSVTYEQVIGGESFDLHPTALNNKAFFSYQTSAGVEYQPSLFEINIDSALYNSNNFGNIETTTVCEVKVKPKFSNNAETFYFYILPKIYVLTASLSINTGDTLTQTELENAISVYKRAYDINNNNKIYLEEVAGEEKTIYSDPDLTLPITSYTANAYEFNEKIVELYCTIKYNGKIYASSINVIVNSSIEIQNANNYLNNGEEILLTELFGFYNTKKKEVINDLTMSSVTFNQTTIDILKNKNVVFLNNEGVEISNPTVVSTIKSIKIPENFTEYVLNGLTANVVATTQEGQDIIKENHSFDLSFKISNLQINENYLVEVNDGNETKKVVCMLTDDNLNNLKYLILSSTVSTIDDANLNIAPTILEQNGKIIFKLNNIEKSYEYLKLDSFATKAEDLDLYIGKAYDIEDLITLQDVLKNNKEHCSITAIKNVPSSDYSIENNHLIFYKAGDNYEIVFNILGREFAFEGFIVKNLEIKTEELTIEEELIVHSNLSYNLLGEDTLKILHSKGITTKFEFLDENNNYINENDNLLDYISIEYETIIVDRTNYLMPTLTIKDYRGEKLSFKIKVTFSSSDEFTGASQITDTITLYKLIIEQEYNETVVGTDGNTRELLLNKYNHQLNNYFNIIKDNEDITTLEYIVANAGESTGTSITSTEENVIEETLEYNKSTNFDLIIKIGDKEVKRIYFFAKNYILEKTNVQTSYYIEQTIYRENLLGLIKVVDDDDKTVSTSRYNNLIIFKRNGEEISSSGLKLTDTITSVTAYMGLLDLNFNVSADTIAWSSNCPTIYNDTKIYNYVTATVNSTNLILKYKPCLQSDGYSCNVTISELRDDVYYLYSGPANLVATLNSVTGELSVEQTTVANTKIGVIPYIASSGVDNGAIIFTVETISANIIQNEIDIYVGDNITDLSQFGQFKWPPNGKPDGAQVKYKVTNLNYDSTLGTYLYNENKNLDRYEIWKGSSIVAYVSGSNFTCTSLIDAMSIDLKGYIYINNTNGYTIESLGNMVLPIRINIRSIDITLPELTQTIKAEGKEYFVVDTTGINTFELNPKENGEDKYFTSLEFQEAFIAKVSNSDSYYTFKSRLLNLTLKGQDGDSTDKKTLLSLPNGYELNIVAEDSTENVGQKIYNQIQMSKTVVDYIFVTLRYYYGSYTNTINLAFVPENSIMFEYAGVDMAYANVVSPAEYVFATGGTLFSMDPTILNEASVLIKPCPNDSDFTADDTNFTTNFEDPYYVYNILYQDDENKISLTIETNPIGTNICDSFVIKIKITETNYYIYKIVIKSIEVKIRNENGDENNNGENAIKLSNNKEIDLKDYIYINNIAVNGSLETEYATIKEHAEKISFNTVEVETENYKVTSDGIFTPLSTIVDNIEIKFELYGKSYSIYIAGENTSFDFAGNFNNLNSGNTYYLYLTKEEGENPIIKAKLTKIKDNSVTELVANVSLSNFLYTLTGNNFNDSYFTSSTSGNDTIYKFSGQNFIRLTKFNTYYELEIYNNILGTLGFDIVVNYSGKIIPKSATVVNEDLIVSYIEPSIINGQMYQNMLSSDRTLILSNFVSGFDKNNSQATFTLSEISTKVSITNGILTILGDIHNNIYLEIDVKVNNLSAKMYVRIIPEIKFEVANSSREFYIVNGEYVNLTKFVNVYKFSYLDAENEPVYKQIVTYFAEEIIETPIAYQVNFENGENQKIIQVVDINDENDDTDDEVLLEFVFKPVSLNINDNTNESDKLLRTCDKGQTINLREYVQNIINASNITFKNASLEFKDLNGYVGSDGLFAVNNAGNYEVKVLINGVEFNIDIFVNELNILINYTNAYAKEENNTLIKYQNIYATQTLAINTASTSDLLEVISNRTLEFSLDILSASNYDIGELITSISQGTLELRDGDSQLLFSINRDVIKCYPTLKGEIYLKVNIAVQDNSLISNVLNLRLLPVEFIVESEVNIYSSDLVDEGSEGFYDLMNYVIKSANTSAEKYNINLNDKVSISIVEKDSSLAAEIKDTTKIKITSGNGKIKIKATLGSDDNAITREIIVNYSYNDTPSELTPASAQNISINENSINNIPTGFAISAIRDSDNYYYTYNLKTSPRIYEVFNSDGQKVVEIGDKGSFTCFTGTKFTLTLELFGSNQTISKELTFNENSNSGVNYASLSSNVIQENGVTLIELFSGEKINITDFLCGGTPTNFVNVGYSNDGVDDYLKSINVNVTSYGYFDVNFGETTQRIYVKTILSEIVLNYEEDFTYVGDSGTVTDPVTGNTIPAIDQGFKFKTEYVSSLSDLSINLKNYVRVPSNRALENEISFTSIKVIAYDDINNQYIFVENANLGDYVISSNANLTLKANGIYYVFVTAKIKNSENVIKLRVLEIYNHSQDDIEEDENITTNLSVCVGDVVDLSKVIQVIAPNEQNCNAVIYEEINILSYLNISLLKGFASFVNGELLYVLDDNNLTLSYTYNGTQLGKIEISVTDEDKKYLYDNINYTEKFYESTNAINIGELSNVSSVNLNGTNYTIITETRTVNLVGSATKQVKYYIVNNLLEICEDGTIKFYNTSYNSTIPDSNKYIVQNNIGIFYITVIKNLSYGYRQEFYKLNNYNIDYLTKACFVNGINRSDLLRYSLVSSNGLAIEGSVITENTISANGVTLNIFDGTYNGFITSDMKIKVYVQEDYRFYGEKFILVNF